MKRLKMIEQIQNLLFILPAMVFFIIFSVYPLFKTFQLSLFEWNGISKNMDFIGLQNYTSALHDKIWWKSVANGFYFAVLALIFMNSLALLLAIIVNTEIKGAKIYRVIFYIPPILSGIVVGYIWKWIYDPNNGILNSVLGYLHMPFLAKAWLSDIKTALTSVAVASIWQGFGGSFILFLAGLKGIPQELYEAAKVDGASVWQQFKSITFPLLSKTYTIVSILTILGAMQILTLIISMTNGGPGFETEVPALRIYKEAFENYKFGYATALSVMLGIMLLIISLIQIKISRKE